MSQYLEFTTASGSPVLVEVADIPSKSGTQRASRTGDVVDAIARQFEDVISPLRGVTESLFNTFKGLVDGPKEVTVEFSLKISAEAGIIISSGAVEGNFKVTLKWTR